MSSETPTLSTRPVAPASIEDYFAGRYRLVLILVLLHQAWLFGLVRLGRSGLLTEPRILLPSLAGPALLFLLLATANTLWERWSPRGGPDQPGGDPLGAWRRDLPLHVVFFDAIALCFASLLLGILGFMVLGLVLFD